MLSDSTLNRDSPLGFVAGLLFDPTTETQILNRQQSAVLQILTVSLSARIFEPGGLRNSPTYETNEDHLGCKDRGHLGTSMGEALISSRSSHLLLLHQLLASFRGNRTMFVQRCPSYRGKDLGAEGIVQQSYQVSRHPRLCRNYSPRNATDHW